jgi:membrane protease YdiL (CAAX protease family)
MSALMGSMSWARIGGRDPNNAWAFWIANAAQAAWFGFGHVAEGLVASQAGGLALATLTAPQTWSGLVFGYVYRRWGLEAAIVAHMASDLLVPAAFACWRLAVGH